MLVAQVPVVGVLANDQGQLNIWQEIQELLTPLWGAFRSWWQVAGFSGAGIAKPHGQECNSGGVVKHRGINTHPAPQTFAAGIIEGNAGFMHPSAGCLADNQNTGGGGQLKHRPNPMRQVGLANIASPCCRHRRFKTACHPSKIAGYAFPGQRLVLFLAELDWIAASGWILYRHGRHFIKPLGVDANVFECMGNADFLA